MINSSDFVFSLALIKGTQLSRASNHRLVIPKIVKVKVKIIHKMASGSNGPGVGDDAQLSFPLPPEFYYKHYTDENVKAGMTPKPPVALCGEYSLFGHIFKVCSTTMFFPTRAALFDTFCRADVTPFVCCLHFAKMPSSLSCCSYEFRLS